MNKQERELEVNEQEVFEKAREELRFYFGLELSLSQQLELKRVWVPETIRQYKEQAFHIDATFFERIEFPEREAAARFMFNNFNLSTDLIERIINSGMPLNLVDKDAYRYLQHQQYESLML